ncbi:MAG: PIN domain nuclease [Desulfamplus sp.]|nr:PIN domain nuclease [Desulfamplus sp.]
MILVDTSVWVDFFNGNESNKTEQLEHFLSSTIIVVGDLIAAELLQGFRSDKDYETAKSLLQECTLVQLCNIDLAVKSAQNYRILRKKGITIRKTIDTIIATYCIENKIPLLFSDRDFEPFVSCLNLQDASKL